MTLPRLPSGSLTQKVVSPSTFCQPVGESVPASKSPLGTRFLAPGLTLGGVSFFGGAARATAQARAAAGSRAKRMTLLLRPVRGLSLRGLDGPEFDRLVCAPRCQRLAVWTVRYA